MSMPNSKQREGTVRTPPRTVTKSIEQANEKVALDYFSLGHPLSFIRSYFAMRARKRMFELFMGWAQPAPNDAVLDLGVTPDETLPESNYFERHYPFPTQIVAASIEDASNLENIFPGIKFKQIAPGRLPFADKSFKFLFCSAVVEHVGTREDQRRFVEELSRVSQAFFVTTPNRWFPVEFHTILPLVHWLPRRIHHWILRALGMGHWADTRMLNLLSARELSELIPAGAQVTLRKIRLAGITSNLVIMGRT